MSTWLGVMLGGALGSALRYGISLGMGARLQEGFPYATLSVNVLGCLLIGVLGVATSGPWPLREELRVALLVGVLGGFTTFSSFGYDALGLIEQGRYSAASAYIAVTNIAGLAAVWFGSRLGRLLG